MKANNFSKLKEAQDKLGKILNYAEWLRGVGIGGTKENPKFFVYVSKATNEIRALIPPSIDGFNIEIREVGEIKAL